MSVKSNQKGFTLPEIMISLGLLGGISIVTVRLIENQANNEAHLKGKAEIQKTTALIKTILNDPDACRNMLKGQVIPALTTSPEVPVATPPALPAPSANPALPGAGLYQRIKLPSTLNPPPYAYKEILLSNSRYSLFRTGTIGLIKMSNTGAVTSATNLAFDNVDLAIQYRFESKSIMNAFRSSQDAAGNANDKTYIHRIPMIVTYDWATKAIRDCGLMASEANAAAKEKFCISLGNMAQWNEATMECKFRESKCPTGEVPDEQHSTGNLIRCVPILNKITVDDIFKTGPGSGCPSGAGGFSVIKDPVSKKLIIKCN